MATGPVLGPLPPGRSRDELLGEVTARLVCLPASATVVLACSGGPDSTALAYLVTEARPDLQVVLAHVNHGLRGADAQRRDRDVVETHAAWLGVALEVRDVEVVGAGHGMEAAARDARYAALRSVADTHGAAAILVGHSADDQAETVLLRLGRGTGLDGLAAMSAVSGDLVRPLLRVRRTDLRAFVELEGLPTSDDATNRDDAVRRVRVRHEVLPALGRIGPDPVGALARLADLARGDASALDEAAARLPDALYWVGPVAVLATDALRGAPVAIARRVVRAAVTALVGQPPSVRTVERVLTTRPGAGASLPGGLELRVDRRWRTLHPRGREDEVDATSLAVPGVTPWPSAGISVRAVTPDVAPDTPGNEQIAFALPGAWTPPTVRLDPGARLPGAREARSTLWLPALADPLSVRSLAPGDRVLTGGGTRRVVEVLRDAGVPRAVRPRWPLVAAGERVVWIPGIEVDRHVYDAGRLEPQSLLHLVSGAGGAVVPARH